MADIPSEALNDPFHPPSVPTEVECLHCGEVYDSYLIEWRGNPRYPHDDDMPGFWCCPIEGCDGVGFGFDIWPTDPDYVGEDGQMMFSDDDEDCDEEDDEPDDEELDPEIQAAIEHDIGIFQQATREDLLPYSVDPEIEAIVKHDMEIIHKSLEESDDEQDENDGEEIADLDDLTVDDDDRSSHIGGGRSDWMDEDDIPF